MEKLACLFDHRCIKHNQGPNHPEQPDRLRTLVSAMETSFEPIREATYPTLAQVHTATHIETMLAARDQSVVFDADTQTNPDSIQAALLAVGAACQAVDVVMTGRAQTAFALVRPPGHHAEAHKAMGFCFFNNIAIAAQHARTQHGITRVAIVDWDVHHGNGTQNSFLSDKNTLVFNTHQWPLYPGSGPLEERGYGDGLGTTFNAPLEYGAGDADILSIFHDLLGPVLQDFEPELILVSAGFDAHKNDPLGGLQITTDGFAHLCHFVQQQANIHCGGKLVLSLEGGYDLASLNASVSKCMAVLNGDIPQRQFITGPKQSTQHLIDVHQQWRRQNVM